MKSITGPFAVALVGLLLLLAVSNGLSQNNGYCIGNQCFVAVQDPTDFATAQSRCAEKEGHLMTVRSSVSHDTLFIILGGRSGEYWIGLHLPSGCPDTSAELRGFQWVTRDGESDFYNWGAFDGTCSPRCVSVSKEGDFKWNQESCDVRAAGYLCEYNFWTPCKRLAVRGDESVAYRTPYGFEGEDVLSLPPGSTAVRRPAETKAICFGEQWLEAPWTCEIDEGGCEHECADDGQQHAGPVCFCPAGQVVNPKNNVTCEVFKDGPCLSLRCEQACFQTKNDTYACMCDHGFELAPDGRSCEDIDDCADERLQCPGEHFACVNTVGAFDCVCESGYRPMGDRCVDVDECVSAPCEHMCANTAGGYECSCFAGYTGIPEAPHKCKLHCGREECPAECDPNDQLQCYCPQGYVSDERASGVFCIDINECDMGYCDQECRNTNGSYVCSCAEGFTLVGVYKCKKDDVDVDTDGPWEGSGGATTPFVFVTSPAVPYPEPTGRPSGVTAGGLLGIIVCIVVVILLLVFLAHHILKKRGAGKLESGAGGGGALKTQGGAECHDLEHVTTEKYEKTASETTLKQDS